MNLFRKLVLILILFLVGCSQPVEGQLEKAGLLLSAPIDDKGWNAKAYQGILNIQSKFGVQVFVKEDIKTETQIIEAVDEFSRNGVNLIFGHSHLYADYFMELKDKYPEMYFVSFNGEVDGDNITSLHFEGYAMGYFAGMLSSEMTSSNKIGVIAAFEFQPEVQGFKDGALYNKDNVEVFVEYVHNWVDETRAIDLFTEMEELGVDIYYPAGDGFHVAVIKEVKKSGLYAIGYVGDQIDLGETTVLTSTVQHVEKLYEFVAESLNNGTLSTGNKYFDFEDGVISLGTFSSEVPDDIRERIEKSIEVYIATGKLPHERED
ncbi:transcriptional activator of comK gene [Evansella vedderi]|uniref:Transcriptional activator of comK protein n=1 Tax=Evansella vedderi TaxID=38282 RepID=A0ABT9ZW09_9BACI|nr:BMP family ABC transporter substrate-binding protein [Evansella vedderi]MDQ0255420.1 transcriptional activator of comK gene [Evansella vedderi]